VISSRRLIVLALLCCFASSGRADTLTWRNTSSDFNASASWRNTTVLGQDRVPTLTDLADFSGSGTADPIVTSTTSVFGVRFGSAALGVSSDYVLSTAGAMQLVILGGGIAASNSLGSNTISASLVLNDNQSITQAAGGTLNITGPVVLGGNTSSAAAGSALTVGSTSDNGTINFMPSAVELAGPLALTSNVNVTLPSVGLLTAPNVSAGITKNGAATLTLSGGSTYNGPTNVNTGKLLATNSGGSATGSGAVTVTGATLGGSGFITGPTTVAGGGTITGGDVGAVGALTLQNLTFSGSSGNLATYLVDLTSTGSDRLSLLGNLDLTSAFDRVQFQGAAGAASYQIATYSGTLTGTFDSVVGVPDGYSLRYDSGSINLVAVPEPGTWAAGVLAFGSVVWLRRRATRAHRAPASARASAAARV
jgi:fibronectin-binding autotransporter adhesin